MAAAAAEAGVDASFGGIAPAVPRSPAEKVRSRGGGG